jgi:hypothetical protein
MARSPYHIARQEHLGDMLDELQARGLLAWEWDYEVRPGRDTGSAVYWVTELRQRRRKLDTKRAEDLAVRLCNQHGIVWLPVPHPGGEIQRTATLRRIEALKQGASFEGAITATRLRRIEPEPFDLTAHPELQQRLSDEPDSDRSAQTFDAARRCIALGLSDGQAKWFLTQYPPHLDKYGERPGADRELDPMPVS